MLNVNNKKLQAMNTEVIENLKKQMRNGVVEFSYTKKDGSTRVAKGTLNFDIMGEDNKPKSGIDYDSNTTTRFLGYIIFLVILLFLFQFVFETL